MQSCTKAYLDSLSGDALLAMIEQCSADYSVFDFLRMHYVWLAGKDYLIYLIIAALLVLLFFNIQLIADDYMAETIGSISRELRLAPSLAAVTLIALANGSPDIINAVVSSARPGGNEIAIGSLLGAFLFCSTLVVANVVHHQVLQEFAVDKFQFSKEVFFYLLQLGLLVFFGVLGRINYLCLALYFGVYVLYLALTVLFREPAPADSLSDDLSDLVLSQQLEADDLDEAEDLERKPREGELQEQRRSRVVDYTRSRIVKKYLWDAGANRLLGALLFPLKVLHFATIPNEFLDERAGLSALVRLYLKFVSHGASIFMSCHLVFRLDWRLSLVASLPLLAFVLLLEHCGRLSALEKYVTQALCLLSCVAWMQLSVQVILDCVYYLSFELVLEKVFLATVIISVGNTLADFFGNGSLARLGHEQMALLACFSGQFFNLSLGLLVNLLLGQNFDFDILGLHTQHVSLEQNFMRILILFSAGSLATNYALVLWNNFKYTSFMKHFLRVYYLIFFAFILVYVFVNEFTD